METYRKIPRKRNFRENVNPLCALFFFHMFPVFQRNYKKGLKETDLCEVLDEQKASFLGDKLETIWKKEYSSDKQLDKSLFRMFGIEFIIYGILQLINELLLVGVLPFAVGSFISYFEESSKEITESHAYIYAGLIISCILINAFITHSTAMGLMHISMKMAIACSSVIYRKCLTLSQSSLVQITSGHIINLLSTDISHFEYGLVLAHYVWISPIQLMLGCYLLYRIIGFAAFLGISLHLLFIPLQIYFGKKKSEYRLRSAVRTDERVNIMNEILQGINVIKMYVWEKVFARRISIARRSEIKVIKACYYLDAITLALEIILPGLSIFLSIIAFIYFGNTIKASTVYSVIAIFDALRPTLTLMFSEGISNLAKVHITIRRVQKFLSGNDVNSSKVPVPHMNGSCNSVNTSNLISSSRTHVLLNNVTASWQLDTTSDLAIKNIYMNIQSNQFVAVIGSVGSGKSSLFHVILNELFIRSGSVDVIGRISYASQTPWLFSASIRQNILFGNDYDEAHYKTVIKICSLESDLNYFPYGDQTMVGERGCKLSGGQKARINLARCIYKNADIYLLDDSLSAVDAKVGKQIFHECIKKFLHDKICIFITHQIQYLQDADRILILNEGEKVAEGTYDELKRSGLNFAKVLPNLHTDKPIICNGLPELDNSFEVSENSDDPVIFKEGMEQKRVKANIYISYFKYGGNLCCIALLLACFVASQVSESGYYFFISHWVDLEEEFKNKSGYNTSNYGEQHRTQFIYIYSGITTTIIALALSQSFFFYSFFMKASINIHDSMFGKIINATMSFFNINPTGVILNRFSDDLGEIDEYIPSILADTLQISLQLVGVFVVTSIINYWFFVPSIGLLLFFILLRNIYMETSRNVKRIEGITRSPIFGHTSATLQGITTIRAFSAEDVLKKEFDNFQDLHTSAWYLYISSNKAFTFWLDFICGIIASLIILSLFVYNTGYHGGDVGLVINEFLSLMGVLQWGMNQWSELENHMTSVERVLEYKDVQTEPIRTHSPNVPKTWPLHGNIIFHNVSMTYNNSDIPVLSNLNFAIKPQEKIGVVGRTGAGKTSTVSALFQLYATNGCILIDDIDITKISLEELRTKIAIIPQEPFLFSGSIRNNLDPFEEYSDDVLWDALEKVQLKEEIESSPLGLYCNVMEAGSNFSVGQKQLICLSRAILRNNRILVLDEATANVDPHTDKMIQETIKKKFSECTVITVAHRLHTIIDSDKIIVMDAGTVVEFDRPYTLLQDCNGKFYSMLQATGEAVADTLHRIAKESYYKHMNVCNEST